VGTKEVGGRRCRSGRRGFGSGGRQG
jgi:hypothetical protein